MKVSTASLALAMALAVCVPIGASKAADVSFITQQAPDQVLAYRLGGTRVFNSKGVVIGNISDTVFNDKGQVQAFVISVGGFLGVGSKYVAVPYSSVRLGPVVESSRVVLLDVTKEQLKAAPSYKAAEPSRTDRAKQQASKWLAQAKKKAIELSEQAKEKVQELRDNMSTPAEGTQPEATPAPPADGMKKE
ncbi:MAG: PRC-barrel domain-containing protein [Hyphomicrobiaceae bacterium]